MVILDQGADDYILVLVFLQFYLKAVLFFCRWIHDGTEAEGGVMLWLQQSSCWCFQ